MSHETASAIHAIPAAAKILVVELALSSMFFKRELWSSAHSPQHNFQVVIEKNTTFDTKTSRLGAIMYSNNPSLLKLHDPS